MKQWKVYAFWILLSEAVGAFSGWITREGIARYNAEVLKPALTPPAIVFPIVWTILFALMGIGAAKVFLAPASEERTQALRVFGLQLAANVVWSLLFFNLQVFGLALLWLLLLWALILWMILQFAKVDGKAAVLQIPYLLWVTFAVYLNTAVSVLNR